MQCPNDGLLLVFCFFLIFIFSFLTTHEFCTVAMVPQESFLSDDIPDVESISCLPLF